MRHNLGDKERILHILDSIENIEVFLKDVDLESFDKNTEKIAAVERMPEIIGEAANHISDEIKYDYKYSTPWKKIIGSRNIIIHEYFRVDNKVIYQTAKDDIIPLKAEIQTILTALENSNK